MTESVTGRQRSLLFDQRFCIGCRSCQVACKDLHNLPAGVNWRRVVAYESGQYPKPEVHYLSLACRHCRRPACVEACPAGAIDKRQEDGIVTLDATICTGCGACRDACPHEAIYIDPTTGIAGKCDLCGDLMARAQQPACVSACTMRVLSAGWLDDNETENS